MTASMPVQLQARRIVLDGYLDWDNRKTLSSWWQDFGGTVPPGGLDALYPALIAFAQQAAQDMLETADADALRALAEAIGD